jgi:hypothetical protein
MILDDRQLLACLKSLRPANVSFQVTPTTTVTPDTMDWVFDSTNPFRKWLEDDQQALFGIHGKPGSGKSTLMRRLIHDPTTRSILAGHASFQWQISVYFFYDGGSSSDQRTITDLLLTILHGIVRAENDLVRTILPIYQEYVVCPRENGQTVQSWDFATLQDALEAVCYQEKVDFHMLLFVDALDEHAEEGQSTSASQNQLLDALETLATRRQKQVVPRIKLCVASRSLPVFWTD